MQLQTYVKDNYLPALMQQLTPLPHGLLSPTVRIDFIKTLRQAKHVASFIIGNFLEFTQLVEDTLLQRLEEQGLKVPPEGVNLTFFIINCSLPRHNLESTEFLTSVFQQAKGVLVFLKDCRVLNTSQPELYLSSWTEQWENSCPCEQQP